MIDIIVDISDGAVGKLIHMHDIVSAAVGVETDGTVADGTMRGWSRTFST